jgi:hypothetical protein
MPPETTPHRAVSSALALVEMRRAILARVDVIQHFVDVANGVMPAKWSAALDIPERIDEVTGKIIRGIPSKLMLEHILRANELLLKRILPEYRQIEVSSDTGDSAMSFEQAKAMMTATLLSAVNSAGGRYVEGKLILPPADAGQEAGPIIDAVVEPSAAAPGTHREGEPVEVLESLDPPSSPDAGVAAPQNFPAAK